MFAAPSCTGQRGRGVADEVLCGAGPPAWRRPGEGCPPPGAAGRRCLTDVLRAVARCEQQASQSSCDELLRYAFNRLLTLLPESCGDHEGAILLEYGAYLEIGVLRWPDQSKALSLNALPRWLVAQSAQTGTERIKQAVFYSGSTDTRRRLPGWAR